MSAIAVIAMLLCAANPASAQVLYGSIVGNVADPNGAVVPDAPVTATNQATGTSQSTKTDAAGAYQFVNLQPGTYSIKVAMPGFKGYERRDLEVSANSTLRTDVRLEIGNIEQAITITGEAPALQTDRAEVRREVSTMELENLPVPIGRNYQQIYRTLPGFSPPVNSHSIQTNPSRALEFNVNGTSDDQNNTRIDGVSSTHIQLPHVVAYVPALESIQEVNVVTNSMDAEQGLAGGAAINVQIKSGTNDIHGSGFEYHSDNHLKAWPWLKPSGASNKPKLVYNQAGGTIGGPIIKNKLFYFASYEGTFDHASIQRRVTVPTAAMRNGDFSSFLSSGIKLYNPYADAAGTVLADPGQRTVLAAPGDPRCDLASNPGCLNIIPQSLMNSPNAQIARKIIALIPAPNLSGQSNNYFASGSRAFDRHTLDSKFNWNVSNSITAFGRFSFLHFNTINPTVFGEQLLGRAIGSSNPGHGTGDTYSATFGGSYTINPRMVIDSYFGFTRAGVSSEQFGLGTNIGSSTLGIPGTNGTRQFESGWPQFEVADFAYFGLADNFMPYYRHDPQYQYVVNFNWIKGSHNFRFGTDVYRMGLNQTQAEWIGGGSFYGAQGGFHFGRDTTALCQDPPDCTIGTRTARPNSFASFLLGVPDEASRTYQIPDSYTIRSMLYSAYARDRWNVTPRLTLSYGVRWEYFPYPHRVDRGLERYDPNTNKVLICGMGSVPSNCGVETSAKRFSPRLGVAWRPTNSLVIRSGYGITNDPYEALELLRNNYPVMVPFGLQTPNSFTPATTLSQGLPAIATPSLGNGVIDIPLNVGFEGLPQDLRRGYIQSWNFTVQKELALGFTASAGYVATRSIRQLGFIDINAAQVPFTNQNTEPLYQQWGRTAATTFLHPLGTGTYDSLQASLQRRFSHGVMFNVNYTWGKAINFVDNSSGTPNIQSLAYMNLNRAVTGFDRTHNMQITSILDLPFGRGRKFLSATPVVTQVVSGWQVNNIFSIMSGPPFSVSGNCSAAWPGNSPTMVDIVGPAAKLGSNAGYNADANVGGYWYDPHSFADVIDPATGNCAQRLGNSGFNNLRAPGVFNWDFGVFRDFAVKERFHIQFRAEAFNFTNTPHFAAPDNSLGDANTIDPKTGRVIDAGQFMTINSVQDLAREGIDERQFRLGLRISF